MAELKNIRTIFFDYDGTLHNSIKVYGPAFRKAYKYLVDNGYAEDRVFENTEIAEWLGYSSKDMWNTFMPSLDDSIKVKCSQIIGETMTELIEEGHAVFYEGAKETLSYLKDKGYQLIFISNCSNYYKELASNPSALGSYFDAMVCTQEYDYAPKYKILEQILGIYPDNKVIIGDRFQDMEAGIKNGIATIGCNYGFGQPEELMDADTVISDVRELMEIL